MGYDCLAQSGNQDNSTIFILVTVPVGVDRRGQPLPLSIALSKACLNGTVRFLAAIPTHHGNGATGGWYRIVSPFVEPSAVAE